MVVGCVPMFSAGNGCIALKRGEETEPSPFFGLSLSLSVYRSPFLLQLWIFMQFGRFI